MRLLSGNVLLRILRSEKEKIFREEIKTGGRVIQLFKAIEQEEDTVGAFEQGIQSAEVIMVADDVKHIQPGDIAIVDYLVDNMPSLVVYNDERGKIVCVDTRTYYHEDDKIAYANDHTRMDVYAWKKGDTDNASLLFGVFRGDKLIPNPPYIICEHRDLQIRSKTTSGMEYVHQDQNTAIRRILVPNEDTDEDVLAGDVVIVERFCLYERELDGKTFDIIMNQDIEIVLD